MAHQELWGPIGHQPSVEVVNIQKEAACNGCFRKVIWSTPFLTRTVMCIPACGEIGVEKHENSDQIIRIESGCALLEVISGGPGCREKKKLCYGDEALIPAGTLHNVKNIGNCPLRVSSLYAPPEQIKPCKPSKPPRFTGGPEAAEM